MSYLLKRLFLLLSLLIGAWLFVYVISFFATFSPETEFTLQQYSFITALIVFVVIVVYERIKVRK
ncbi:hypothetical protein [Flavobacterium cerinum]|uniref:Uncharacterized protein n=1 Tax=Flavobacterium cerinum TaxID=2502784 RepID=A0A3S3QCG8_9FLAO|nr:hypothetical protein [Flavobacterium cerinum]RWW98918.1 hypothetical protein EPI11_13415 [Flavobacterium cerinum]